MKEKIIPRFKALIFDWLFICGYLLLIFIVALVIYLLVLDGIPEFTNLQSQLIATFTSVVPIIIIFSIMEGSKRSASWGKSKVGLKVIYKGSPVLGSITRNTLKFLPWQLGHMSTINGMYNDFDAFSIVFLVISLTLSVIYILMVVIRKDGTHFVDILAGSKVVIANN